MEFKLDMSMMFAMHDALRRELVQVARIAQLPDDNPAGLLRPVAVVASVGDEGMTMIDAVYPEPATALPPEEAALHEIGVGVAEQLRERLVALQHAAVALHIDPRQRFKSIGALRSVSITAPGSRHLPGITPGAARSLAAPQRPMGAAVPYAKLGCSAVRLHPAAAAPHATHSTVLQN